MNDVTLDQIAYYRARAAEYDEWWFRRGRYDQGAARNALWRREVATVEAALRAANPRGHVLDIACGTGLWTRLLAPRADRVTAVDTSRETIDINRARAAAANVDYVEADVFAWRPSRRYDFVFLGFWISHIPHDRWNGFWSMLEDAVADDGSLFFVDNNAYAYRAESRRTHRGRDTVEERVLNDGRRFTIVKNFFDSAALQAELAMRGWHGFVRETEAFFIYGALARAVG